MSDPSRTSKSSCFRKFTQHATLTNHSRHTGYDCSYDDLPVGGERLARPVGKTRPKMTHKQQRSANTKGASAHAAQQMHHKLCNSANKNNPAFTPPPKWHGETLNSYRARVAKWEKKNGL